jgi:methylmalonyl-CoA mutase N-terminal domain/subunit
VNRYQAEADGEVEVTRIDLRQQREQTEALQQLRARRDAGEVERRLDALEAAAQGTDNLMYPLKAALAAYATIGECCDRLRRVFGEYQPPEGI